MSFGYLSYVAINRRSKRLQLSFVSEMVAGASALAVKTRAVRRTEKITLRAHANYTPPHSCPPRQEKRLRMALSPEMVVAQLFVSRAARNTAETAP